MQENKDFLWFGLPKRQAFIISLDLLNFPPPLHLGLMLDAFDSWIGLSDTEAEMDFRSSSKIHFVIVDVPVMVMRIFGIQTETQLWSF